MMRCPTIKAACSILYEKGDNSMEKMLEGIRVIDFTGFAAGPTCTKFLTEWGAEDIVIEPLTGSTVRTAAPDNVDFYGGFGKKYIALDLKSPEGKEAAYRLIKSADVFIHNYRPRAIKKLGLDYETLKEINPRLVWAQITGYGEEGPNKDDPGYDTVCFWARSGFMGDLAEKGTVLIPPISVGDSAAGQGLAGAICAALYRREKTGLGTKVDISLFAEALFLHHHAIIASQLGRVQYPQSRLTPWRATLNSYRCKDGKWVALMCGGSPANHEKEFPRMMRALDRPDIADDPRFKPYSGVMFDNAPRLVKILDEVFAQFDREEIISRIRGVDVAVERIQTALDLVNDPQAQANNLLMDVDTSFGEHITIPTTPVHFGDNQPCEYSLLPPMGVHTVDLLKGVGYSQEEIMAMAEKNITVVKE